MHCYFIAPGNDDVPLPGGDSPWRFTRIVEIPMQHWNLILNFAEPIGPDMTRRLRSYTETVRQTVQLDYPELEKMIAFLKQVQEAILTSAPLTPEPTAEMPDNYINEEYSQMVQDVMTVLTEANRLRQPFITGCD